MQGKNPCIIEILTEIELLESIEFYNARLKGNLCRHNRKWAPFNSNVYSSVNEAEEYLDNISL